MSADRPPPLSVAVPMDKREFILRRVSEIEITAEISLNRFADPGNEMFGCGRNGNAVSAFLQGHNALQRPNFLGLSFHISNSVQELLTMIPGKSAAELDYSSSLPVPYLQARRAEFPLQATSPCRCSPLPDTIPEQKVAFWAAGVRRIFSGLLIGPTQFASFLSSECIVRLLSFSHQASFSIKFQQIISKICPLRRLQARPGIRRCRAYSNSRTGPSAEALQKTRSWDEPDGQSQKRTFG
jgi:hypothetical protein